MQPVRRKLEPGIYERTDQDGHRLGLELVYKDAAGKTRRRAVQGDLNAARDELARVRVKRADHRPEPFTPRPTVAAVIDRYQRAHAGDRANTRAAYRSGLQRIRDQLGDRQLAAVNRADVRELVNRELDEGLKANTVRSHYSTLRALYSFAREDLELPVVFPALPARDLPDPQDDQREHRVLDAAELAAVLHAAPDRSRLLFELLAETGARVSEGLGLTPDKIRGATITIARQLARDRTLKPLKTRQSKRTIETTRGLAAQLQLAGDRERVFPLVSHRDVERDWATALDRAHLTEPQPVLHDLRHTHASRLIAAGMDPVQVARRLGDRVETILRTYAHEFDARTHAAERRQLLEELYGGEMATDGNPTAAQAVTNGAQVVQFATVRDTSR